MTGVGVDRKDSLHIHILRGEEQLEKYVGDENGADDLRAAANGNDPPSVHDIKNKKHRLNKINHFFKPFT